MSTPGGHADWARLLRIACALVRQVNSEQSVIASWTLGGGTAMMLQIDHRESRDVDIFLPDPQWLPFLDPEKHDFTFEIPLAGHAGDGSRFLKLVFDNVGEIDFIVARPLTSSPTMQTSIEGETVLLETIPEIVAKKICHRGSSIKPRDIFDIAAAGERNADAIIGELRNHRDEVAKTLMTLDKLNPDFVKRAIAQLSIRAAYTAIAEAAMERTKEILRAV